MDWGYYCKTCDETSQRWLDDPRELRRIYLATEETLEEISIERRMPITREIMPPLLFLRDHFGHELWVNNDYASLRLPDLESRNMVF